MNEVGWIKTKQNKMENKIYPAGAEFVWHQDNRKIDVYLRHDVGLI